ncbi:3-isopropylmalate dehydratase [Planctomycetales bacterium ZRK34]|nr:3-isopropylmalate dehydratase [Planctomycetales bacterium ZRK34]
MQTSIRGKAYVLGDDIDTDQIIPAEHLIYSMTDPEERKLYGKYANIGVPAGQRGLPDGNIPFVEQTEGNSVSDYQIIIGGKNFGCGSSREHAPFALAEAGAKAVIAEFYARIFYRNCVNGGFLVPCEATQRLVDEISTGDDVEVDLAACKLIDHTTGKTYDLKELGDVKPIIDAGGVFAYAKQAGML